MLPVLQWCNYLWSFADSDISGSCDWLGQNQTFVFIGSTLNMALPVSSDCMGKTETVISNSENSFGNNLPGTGYIFSPSLSVLHPTKQHPDYACNDSKIQIIMLN